MDTLHKSRCINHSSREAVARCPVCRHFFCRECVTEHGGKVICASCLQKSVSTAEAKKTTGRLLRAAEKMEMAFRAAVGLFLLWIVFYAVGQILLAIPSDFHSGNIWRNL